MAKCSVETCNHRSRAHGFCRKHYMAFYRTGDPLGKFHHADRGPISSHPLWRTWNGMWRRCTDERVDSYKNYGARGISVCQEWKDFWTFAKDVGPRPSDNHSLDRINNDGNYEPSNCRWATPDQQIRNRRVTVMSDDQRALAVSMFESGQTKKSIAKDLGLEYHAILSFLNGAVFKRKRDGLDEFMPVQRCSVPGCERAHQSQGLCKRHFRRLNESKSFAGVSVHGLSADRACKGCNSIFSDDVRPDALFCTVACKMAWNRREGCYTQEAQLASRGACDIPGCGKPKHAQGVCRAHYMKAWHAGETVDLETLIAAENATIKCESCAQDFKPTKKNQTFCSSKCYHRAYRAKHPRNREGVPP